VLFAGGAALALGCSGAATSHGFADPGGSSSGGNGASSGGSGGSSSGSLSGSSSGSNGGGGCNPNPANYDIPNNGCDDDGDGKVDNVTVCDQALAMQGTAHDFANALGICQDSATVPWQGGTATKWGIVSVAYTQGYNSTANPNDGQHGILASFGSVIKPREGSRLGVLSSGYAREWDDSNGTSGSCDPMLGGPPCFKGPQMPMTNTGTAPPGYPKPAAGCMNASDVHDVIGVTLKLLVPANAQGLQFDFDFYSGEWPEYVCTNFNDSFVAWLQSAAYPGNGGDLNISFDAKGNPVSVNNGFFDRCTPNTQTGCAGGTPGTAACAGGPNELMNTGFYDLGSYCGAQSTGGGATGWLTTKAPVQQAETITLQFIIWDTGDANWDSSVLVDNFQWQPGPTMTGTGRPPQ